MHHTYVHSYMYQDRICIIHAGIRIKDHGYMHHGYMYHGYMHHGYMHHIMDTCIMDTCIMDMVTRPERPKGAKDKVKEARRAAD